METFVLVVHVLIASVMTVLILLQQGKGADAGASFGAGGAQTVFGSAGSASFLTKATAVLALIFFVTSIVLAIYAKQQVTAPILMPAAPTQKAPVTNTDLPAAPPAAAPASNTPANSDLPTSSSTETSNPTPNPVK
ncbi:preprotein translocase subunit SecG [Agitococcus lubricus]|uniref:Protein-export membrane protein SecG n=1 Tax=Agitococcus lubricus TaxID=1077255 RepID=A0A2T5J3C9_9GAMM|nr:preprotein translocase subunit SecG [Agitococcus lubricus]